MILMLLFAGPFLFAKEPIDLQMITRIKREGFQNSQVMNILGNLTDVYGPRLSGSASLKKAGEWCRDQLADWGLENARLGYRTLFLRNARTPLCEYHRRSQSLDARHQWRHFRRAGSHQAG
jgi:hypothetical protein